MHNFKQKINLKFITRAIYAGAICAIVAGTTLVPQSAQARLDELITPDTPYWADEYQANRSATAAVEAAAVGAALEAAPRVYIVRPGDSLSLIAARHNLSVDKLARMNQLKDYDCIIQGQVLMLPGTSFPYQVKEGESLGLIASRFGVSARELAEMNNLRNPDRVIAGQVLTIPAGQGGGETMVSRSLPINQLHWPVAGWISSPFGMRDGGMHEGIDIAADHGQAVRAVKGGTVVFSGPRGTYGQTVIIDHGNGLRTLYAHNSRLLVSEGQKVLAGQPIARVGSTGRSTGPHLHMEVLLNGVPLDPLLCLQRGQA